MDRLPYILLVVLAILLLCLRLKCKSLSKELSKSENRFLNINAEKAELDAYRRRIADRELAVQKKEASLDIRASAMEYANVLTLKHSSSSRKEQSGFYCESDTIKDFKAQLDKKQSLVDELHNNFNENIKSDFSFRLLSLAQNSPFRSTPAFRAFSDDNLFDNERFIKAFEDKNMSLVSVPVVSARVKGQSGLVYNVTLGSCTCEDFKRHQKPCKHMYRLALNLGSLSVVSHDTIEPRIQYLLRLKRELQDEKKMLSESRARHEQDKIRTINEIKTAQNNLLQKNRAECVKIAKNNDRFFAKLEKYGYNMTWIAKMYGDYYYLFSDELIRDLRSRIRPANSTANRIEQKFKDEIRRLAAEGEYNKMLVALYESFYPDLPQLCDMSPGETPADLDAGSTEIKTEYDSMRKWLSRAEYDLLSSAERNQLALDNYKHRKRSNWEAGRDYERYIGYCYEKDGYPVDYFGAIKGFEDLGRDLYVYKDGKVLIIQCKRWTADKVIHEKHIFQLFGTVTMYRHDHPLDNVQGLLLCTCELSDTAKEIADLLCIDYKHVEYVADYPMIKCNIGATGEKIYHLPFDLQYDRVKIEPNKGEFYAHSIKEAERKGFRRAKHWISDSQNPQV